MAVLEELSKDEFEREKQKKINEIEVVLRNFLKDSRGELRLQHTILEAMEYSLMGGGKRLRPMFMEEAYALFSKNREKEESTLFYFMAAMEMIHTYSLVHDDLPAMDNDD
ncbi:MAG: polyprenyl synthetase family protein, partial [Lachnospiraceae bacterium]|nr:polyprenyl synthetase family protein [Lachnospiraceae bacterium]